MSLFADAGLTELPREIKQRQHYIENHGQVGNGATSFVLIESCNELSGHPTS